MGVGQVITNVVLALVEHVPIFDWCHRIWRWEGDILRTDMGGSRKLNTPELGIRGKVVGVDNGIVEMTARWRLERHDRSTICSLAGIVPALELLHVGWCGERLNVRNTCRSIDRISRPAHV